MINLEVELRTQDMTQDDTHHVVTCMYSSESMQAGVHVHTLSPLPSGTMHDKVIHDKVPSHIKNF